MTSISTQHSATIYQFPLGGRAGLVSANNGRSETDRMTFVAGDYAMIDAWYHQVAISDSQKATKQ